LRGEKYFSGAELGRIIYVGEIINELSEVCVMNLIVVVTIIIIGIVFSVILWKKDKRRTAFIAFIGGNIITILLAFLQPIGTDISPPIIKLSENTSNSTFASDLPTVIEYGSVITNYICEFQEIVISFCAVSAIFMALIKVITKRSSNNKLRERKKNNDRIYIIGAIVLISLFSVTFYIHLTHEKVPDVIDLTFENAKQTLKGAEFQFLVVDPEKENYNTWQVKEQKPVADNWIPKGSTVQIMLIPPWENELDVIGESVELDEIKNIDEAWKNIKICWLTERYNQVIDIAETFNLLNTEEMLNIHGVMYANGFYYEKDNETAIKYFTAAVEHGEKISTFENLLLISHITDQYDLMINNPFLPFSNTFNAFEIVNNNDIEELSSLLLSVTFSYHGTNPKECLQYIRGLENTEIIEIFNRLRFKVGEEKYKVAMDFRHYVDENGELKAEATRIEERALPIMATPFSGFPSKFLVLENRFISPNEGYVVIE
jgi:hypothetical protein